MVNKRYFVDVRRRKGILRRRIMKARSAFTVRRDDIIIRYTLLVYQIFRYFIVVVDVGAQMRIIVELRRATLQTKVPIAAILQMTNGGYGFLADARVARFGRAFSSRFPMHVGELEITKSSGGIA